MRKRGRRLGRGFVRTRNGSGLRRRRVLRTATSFQRLRIGFWFRRPTRRCDGGLNRDNVLDLHSFFSEINHQPEQTTS